MYFFRHQGPDLNCFRFGGEWLYHVCVTDPKTTGLAMVLLSLKTRPLGGGGGGDLIHRWYV